MMEFGRTLRAAREAKGCSISDVAEATHMLSAIVQGLEDDDFSKIPAPIYGRGFVKLYCEYVGIDPKPLITVFMDLYQGKGEPIIRERPVAPEQPPVASEQPPVASEQPPSIFDEPSVQPSYVQPDLMGVPAPAPQSTPPPAMRFEPPPAPPTQPPAPAEPSPAPAEPKLARYASPVVTNYTTQHKWASFRFTCPSRVWRLALVGLAAVVFLVLVCLGVRALYRVTTQNVPENAESGRIPSLEPPAPATAARPTKPDAPTMPGATRKPEASSKAPPPAVRTKRTYQAIPPLYID